MKPRTIRKIHAQRGFTLAELVISMALGVTLMAGVVQVFIGTNQTDRTQESLARMQEAGRFAFNFLSQDLRSAGYIGCSSTQGIQINNILSNPPNSFQPATGIQGWEAAGTGFGSVQNSVADEAAVTFSGLQWGTTGGNILDVSGNTTSILPGTDVLRVWGVDASGNGNSLGTVESVTPGVAPVVNVTNMDISNGDIILLSDCEFADWIQPCSVSTLSGPPITLNLTLSASCTPGNMASSSIRSSIGADVVKLSGTSYYIGKRGGVATNPPALFRRTLSNNADADTPEELVEGIENMQILYGENTDNDSRNSADRYVTANNVSDWTNVVSVRISILVQSLNDSLVPSPQSYSYYGVDYTGISESGVVTGNLPPDGRLRRVFTTTIGLRNRTLGG